MGLDIILIMFYNAQVRVKASAESDAKSKAPRQGIQ
jgi:hypothetical protein